MLPQAMSQLSLEFASCPRRDPLLQVSTVGVAGGIVAQKTKHKKPHKKDDNRVNRDFQ
jgi:hypothetical protein